MHCTKALEITDNLKSVEEELGGVIIVKNGEQDRGRQGALLTGESEDGHVGNHLLKVSVYSGSQQEDDCVHKDQRIEDPMQSGIPTVRETDTSSLQS